MAAKKKNAPWGLKADGTPRSKPGRKASGEAKAPKAVKAKAVKAATKKTAYGVKADGSPRKKPGRKAGSKPAVEKATPVARQKATRGPILHGQGHVDLDELLTVAHSLLSLKVNGAPELARAIALVTSRIDAEVASLYGEKVKEDSNEVVEEAPKKRGRPAKTSKEEAAADNGNGAVAPVPFTPAAAIDASKGHIPAVPVPVAKPN